MATFLNAIGHKRFINFFLIIVIVGQDAAGPSTQTQEQLIGDITERELTTLITVCLETNPKLLNT